MADNITITQGTGTIIGTDQVGTVHYQKVKLVDGTAEGETPIAVGIGAKTNALRIAPANDITDATYIGDIKFGESLPAGDNNIGQVDIASIAKELTKSVAQINDWTAVAQNTVGGGVGYDYDMSGDYEVLICIQAFLDSTTAHTGTEFVVQISSNTSENESIKNEDWQDFTKWVGLVGTAVKDDIENNPLAQGATTITLTGHTYTVLGKWLAIEDTTLVNSELIYEVAQSTNSITILNGTANEHQNTADIYNVAETYVILIPASVAKWVRVVVNNTYDSDGSSLNYKVRISRITKT